MSDEREEAEGTAVRVALWRAMHVQVDPPPHVLDDVIGLELAAPDGEWRQRPDMDPEGTRWFRAGIWPVPGSPRIWCPSRLRWA